MERAVHRKILSKIRHPAGDTEIKHVALDKLVLDKANRVRVGQVQHPRVKGGGFDVINAAVRMGDQPALLRAQPIEPAPLYQVGVDIGKETHAPGAQLFNGLLQTRVEALVKLPVPPDLLSHDRAQLARPVLAPDSADFCPGVKHGKGLVQNGPRAPLDAEDHPVVAPIRNILPVGNLLCQKPSERFKAVPPQKDKPRRAAVKAKNIIVLAKFRAAVRPGVKQDQPPGIRDEHGHGGIAADLAVLLLPIPCARQNGLFQNGGSLYVLGYKIDDPLPAQVYLPVLLPAAEDRLARDGRQAELTGPAAFPFHGQ